MTLLILLHVLPVQVWPVLASALLVLQSGPILWPLSLSTFMTFTSRYLLWPCSDLTSVTFDMTVAIGVIVTPKVLCISGFSLIRMV